MVNPPDHRASAHSAAAAKDKGTGITAPSDSGLLQPGSLGRGGAESLR